MTLATKRLGKSGEDYACRYLQRRGYKIMARNFRCRRYGEIDIVAQKNGVLYFVEVKTRSSFRYGLPCEAVTAAKQAKIYRCAEYYLQLNGFAGYDACKGGVPPLSFDVIEIFRPGAQPGRLRHRQHCF